jgi:hypothetical protein
VRGENGRRKGEIPGEEEAQFGSVAGSLSTVSGGRGEEDLEARRWLPDLCDRIAVAGGPRTGCPATGKRQPGKRTLGGRTCSGFFLLFWNGERNCLLHQNIKFFVIFCF